MQQRHTSRNSPLQDLATSAFAPHWVLEVASGCRLGVATLATFCLGAPNITQLVLEDCQYPRLIPGVLYYIYIYSCIVNPTYNWIISDGYSTFPTSSCFLSLATPFLKPSRSPDWPLPFSRRCVLGAYHCEPAINWKGGARLSQEWLHNYSIYMWVGIYIYGYGPAFQPPSPPPRPWSWVSDSTVPLPAPVVWWGCGTVPLPLGMVCLIWQYVCSVRYVWLLWWVWNVCYVT